MRTTTLALGLMSLLTLTTDRATAAPVTFVYGGDITRIHAGSPPDLAELLGDPFFVSVTFDSETADLDPSSEWGSYRSPSGSTYGIRVWSGTFSESFSGVRILVQNSNPEAPFTGLQQDIYNFSATRSDGANVSLNFQLEAPTAPGQNLFLTSDNLLTDVAPYCNSIDTFLLLKLGDGGGFTGKPLEVVSEPSTAGLAALGMAAVALSRRRRKKAESDDNLP